MDSILSRPRHDENYSEGSCPLHISILTSRRRALIPAIDPAAHLETTPAGVGDVRAHQPGISDIPRADVSEAVERDTGSADGVA